MKTKFLCTMVMAVMLAVTTTVKAQTSYSSYGYATQKRDATIAFRNNSDYAMTLRIVGNLEGRHIKRTVSLPARSSQVASFDKSGTLKLKIKATRCGLSSYHDGGKFSITCNDTEWTEGEMTFQMSTYGSGLGPSISAEEFESDR